MASINPRIIVVDRKQETYHFVRSALDLLERRPRLIHVHTAADALQELNGTGADLLVTALTLPDTTDGSVLALQAKREFATLPIIVLAEPTDPEPENATLGVFDLMRRPLSPETFLRGLRVALDGPEAVPHQATVEEAALPVPDISYGKLSAKIFALMSEVRAMAAVLATRTGRVIGYEGAAGYVDRDLLAAALGAGFANLPRVLSIIGDQPRVLSYVQGDKRDIFTLAVGLHHYLMLIYDGTAPTTALASVRRFGTQTVADLIDIITPQVAFSLNTLPPEAAPPAAVPSRVLRRVRTEEMSAVSPVRPAPPESLVARAAELPAPVAPRVEAKHAPRRESPFTPATPIANFDASLFDNLDDVDLSQADGLFDLEPLNLTPREELVANGKISFDDAMMQGIIGKIEE